MLNIEKLSKLKPAKWFLKHSLTIGSCVLILVLGITSAAWSSPGTTTVGENISTGNLTASGNISGTWQGSAIGTQYGGTGQNWSSAVIGSIPYFSDTGILSALTPGTDGLFLKSQGASSVPTWDNISRTTTYVLAAPEAPAHVKSQADYVCDGTADTAEAQA